MYPGVESMIATLEINAQGNDIHVVHVNVTVFCNLYHAHFDACGVTNDNRQIKCHVFHSRSHAQHLVQSSRSFTSALNRQQMVQIEYPVAQGPPL